jgi:hypothetical protein
MRNAEIGVDLQAENAALIEKLRLANASLEDWIEQYRLNTARIEQLEAGLRRYGQHDRMCVPWERPPCTCGLDALLAAQQPGEKE